MTHSDVGSKAYGAFLLLNVFFLFASFIRMTGTISECLHQ